MTIKADRAISVLARFKSQRILVVGDLMLDRYIYGSVSRISPEAPVPVALVTGEKSMPGGATNVAWNVQSLGSRAAVSGILGRDHAALELKRVLKQGKVCTDGAMECSDIKTTVKMRVVAERQQVVRVDWEDRVQLAGQKLKAFCRLVQKEVKKSTGVIIEDYSKGVVGQEIVDTILQTARRQKIPVGLDPKDNQTLKFAGITVATPNRKEAYLSAGVPESRVHPEPLKDKELLGVGRILLKKWSPELLMITLGPQGMLLMSRHGAPRHVPTRAREVFDVSGAGDTVIATCVLAMAAGADYVEAAELANYAAGIVVGKLGTATCTQEELLKYLS